MLISEVSEKFHTEKLLKTLYFIYFLGHIFLPIYNHYLLLQIITPHIII